MEIYPIEKYRFVVLPEKRMVIALTSYRGKTVKGVAICSEHDEWDEEVGKRIASARAGVNVARRRLKEIQEDLDWTEKKIAYLENMRESDIERYERAQDKFDAQFDELCSALSDAGVL